MKQMYTLLAAGLLLAAISLHAQTNTFPASGRAGINTLSPAAALQVNGGARIGTLTNYVNIDSATGNLSFSGTAGYRVAGNKYAFQFADNPNIGLYFNYNVSQYEFRNSNATPVFSVNAKNGNGAFSGTLKVGAYTLPTVDGTNGQVLKTNGSGVLSWKNDSTAAGAGWSLTGNNGTLPGTNFLGTTDNQPLQFKVNNQLSGLLNISQSVTAFGYQALLVNTGTKNSAFGYQALKANSTGQFNTAVGTNALNSNTSASRNTAVGTNALYTNTGESNTALGTDVLFYNTIGTGNTAAGTQAMVANTKGNYNAAFGQTALNKNTEGFYNTAVGNQALKSNTLGNTNTALGAASMQFNNLGTSNTAMGFLSLYQNTNGNENTAAGFRSLQYSLGSWNTAIGDSTLLTLTNGNYNTAIGHRANVAFNNLTNATAIGANAYVSSSNSLVLGSVQGQNGAAETVKVGIGTIQPEERLHVVGKIKTTDFQMINGANDGYVLKSDASGNASWVNNITNLEADPKVSSSTINIVPKWDGTSLVDGIISDDGVSVGIGMGSATPRGKLEVSGGDAFIYEIRIGRGSGGITHNQASTVVGYEALGINSSGTVNTAIGYRSLKLNSTGSSNTALGGEVLYANDIGSNNTGIGNSALFSNRGGIANTAVGYKTNFLNQNGSYNTSIGSEALYSNNFGSTNTANGNQALYSNRTGYSNVAIGAGALHLNTISSNLVAVGDSALYNNTALYNTAVGSKALYSNTGSSENTALGHSALFNNTGWQNTAIGSSSLYYNTSGAGNTAVGSHSLATNTTGQNNTAMGLGSLVANTTGYGNTAIGNALYANTTGNYNTAVGLASLPYNGEGNANTALGWFARGAIANLDNSTAIGSYALVDASNKVSIGNTSVNSISGQVGWTVFSDARIKDSMKENVPGLRFIKALKPVTYHYNVQKQNNIMGIKDSLQWKGKYDIEKMTFSGFVAQDVEAAAKKINYDFSGVDKSGKIMGLRYAEFVVPLVKAVQELSNQNDSLQSINKNLQSRLEKLEQIVQYIQECNPCNETPANSTVDQFSTKLGDEVTLEQNIPNPFSNTTVIHFTLPAKFTNARMVITDKTGKILKQINISGSGRGSLTVDAATLSNGAYQYTLWIENKLVATKQMLLVK